MGPQVKHQVRHDQRAGPDARRARLRPQQPSPLPPGQPEVEPGHIQADRHEEAAQEKLFVDGVNILLFHIFNIYKVVINYATVLKVYNANTKVSCFFQIFGVFVERRAPRPGGNNHASVLARLPAVHQI